MRKVLCLLALAVVTMGAEDCAGTSTGETDLKPQAEQSEPASEPTAEPAGKYDLACAYELGDFSENPESGYRFTGGGTLTNTGGGDIKVRVVYKWRRLGQGAKTVRKTYTVREGQSREVNVTVPASSSDIDAHQNAGAGCSATAKIAA